MPVPLKNEQQLYHYLSPLFAGTVRRTNIIPKKYLTIILRATVYVHATAR